MALYIGDNGVNRRASTLYVGDNGINRKCNILHIGDNGVNRRIVIGNEVETWTHATIQLGSGGIAGVFTLLTDQRNQVQMTGRSAVGCMRANNVPNLIGIDNYSFNAYRSIMWNNSSYVPAQVVRAFFSNVANPHDYYMDYKPSQYDDKILFNDSFSVSGVIGTTRTEDRDFTGVCNPIAQSDLNVRPYLHLNITAGISNDTNVHIRWLRIGNVPILGF